MGFFCFFGLARVCLIFFCQMIHFGVGGCAAVNLGERFFQSHPFCPQSQLWPNDKVSRWSTESGPLYRLSPVPSYPLVLTASSRDRLWVTRRDGCRCLEVLFLFFWKWSVLESVLCAILSYCHGSNSLSDIYFDSAFSACGIHLYLYVNLALRIFSE